MVMEGRAAQEPFPQIGTVENPALFFDGSDFFPCYDLAPASGGGTAILRFSHVVQFEKTPVDVEGLHAARYPATPWEFTEITGSDRTAKRQHLRLRFWTISFNDVTVEIVFAGVEMVQQSTEVLPPSQALLRFLGR